jgi:protease-4
MKSPLKKITTPTVVRIFAVIGVITTVLVAIVIAILTYEACAAPSEPDSVILTLDLDQPIVEQSDQSPLGLAMHEDSIPLLDILHAIDSARDDPHVKGLAALFGSEQPSLAQAEEIRSALARFRASGKPTYAFGTSYGDFGNGNRAYFIASGFENIWLQPAGAVGLTGLAIEAPFGKTALEKIGVSGDFLRREEYKSVMETFTRDDFSPPVRANMQSMLDDLAAQEAEGIALGRKWDPSHVKQLMEKGPFTASEALKNDLVTHIGGANELDDELKKMAGDDVEQVGVEDYLDYGGGGGRAKKPKARVALIFGTGLITDHAVGPSDVTGDEVMGADEIAGAFDDAAEDKKIKAIIFRIDSPGGSPSAAETIRSALVHAQKAGKPVFVSMGGEAASGGYWVAMNADQIIAEPGTITGSIGVVAGKFVLGGLMQKIGVSWDHLTTGGNGDMWSMTQAYTPEQRARIDAFLDETYKDFVQGVATARHIPLARMGDIAKGRVWTGAQAQKIGLVDQLGGFDVTLGAVRKQLNLTPDDMMSIDLLPAPLTPAEKVLKLLKGIGIESAMIRTALGQWQKMQTVVGPVWSEMNARGPLQARAILPVVR